MCAQPSSLCLVSGAQWALTMLQPANTPGCAQQRATSSVVLSNRHVALLLGQAFASSRNNTFGTSLLLLLEIWNARIGVLARVVTLRSAVTA